MDILEKNTIAIMFPYIRSYISSITTQPGMSPIVLPAMNIVAMVRPEKIRKSTQKWVLFSWQEFWGLSEVQSMCNLGTAIENKGIEIAISPRTRLYPFMTT